MEENNYNYSDTNFLSTEEEEKHETQANIIAHSTFESSLINTEPNFIVLRAMKKIGKIAFPTIIVYLSLYLQDTISFAFIGHIYDKKTYKEYIRAIGLSTFYLCLTFFCNITGIAVGFEVIASNAYGAKKLNLLTTYFQRAQLIGFIFSLMLIVINNTTAINVLYCLNIDDILIVNMKEYIKTFMYASIFDLQNSINFRLFNIIGRSYVNIIQLLFGLILHPFITYYLLIYLNMGLKGIALSYVIRQIISSIGGLLYIIIKKPLPTSIFSYSKHSFQGWSKFLKIALPAIFIESGEGSAFSFLNVIAAWIGSNDYSAHMLINNLSNITYSITIGFGAATSIMISKYICINKVEFIKKYAFIIFSMGLCIKIIFCFILYLLRKHILFIFLDDEQIINKGIPVIVLLIPVGILDYTQGFLTNVYRGISKHVIAGPITFVSHNFVLIGSTIYLGKFLNMGVFGIWIGICTGYLFCSVVYIIVLKCLNMEKIKSETILRIHKEHDKIVNFITRQNIIENNL